MKSLSRWLVAGVLAAGAVVTVGTIRTRRQTSERVENIRATADGEQTPYSSDRTEDLPAPVRRYFDAVLEEGQPAVRSVRLEQRGEFRLGDRTSPWKPMTATQHYSVDPPGFVWDASVRIAPLISVRVVDAYERGRGSLAAKLLSTVPVAQAGPSPEMDEGELMRYLGEAVWFPTALLPEAGVEWEAIDDRSARATLRDRDTSVSLVFHFDDDGLVERVTGAERYRQTDGALVPWTGYFEDYEWHDGTRIPTAASVEWNLDDGPLPYWRATVTSIEYDAA